MAIVMSGIQPVAFVFDTIGDPLLTANGEAVRERMHLWHRARISVCGPPPQTQRRRQALRIDANVRRH